MNVHWPTVFGAIVLVCVIVMTLALVKLAFGWTI